MSTQVCEGGAGSPCYLYFVATILRISGAQRAISASACLTSSAGVIGTTSTASRLMRAWISGRFVALLISAFSRSTSGLSSFGGPDSENHVSDTKSLWPSSRKVGTVGRYGSLLPDVTASGTSLPASTWAPTADQVRVAVCTLPANRSMSACEPPL